MEGRRDRETLSLPLSVSLSLLRSLRERVRGRWLQEEFTDMLYAAMAIILILVVIALRHRLFPPIPQAVASLGEAERLVDYHVQVANRRLRRDAWMLTFVVPQLDLERRRVTVRIGINYRRSGYPNYLGQFQQAWANAQVMLQAKEKIAAAFAKRGFQATIETFT